MIEHGKCTFFVTTWAVKYEMGMQVHSKNKERVKRKAIYIGDIKKNVG